MEKQQIERQDGNAAKMPMSALAGPSLAQSPEQSSEQSAAWAGSPETAAAKESVRRDAATASGGAPSAAALEAQVNLPSPSAELATAGGGVVGPELVAHVAAQERELKADALTRGYQAVVAGGAAANGQPEAQAAVAAAPPEMREAAQAVAADQTSGAPLPDDVRAKMETKLGADFSDVQVHVGDDRAATLGAGAATAGTHIYFAPGKYQPGTAEGDKLLAHELTHVVQQRGAQTKGAGANKSVVAGSTSHAEQEAEKVGAAVHAGADVAPIAAGTAEADVHLGEAGVHQGIELEAAGVGGKFDPDKLTPEQKAALEMYSGNFMRDYSQLAAPTPLAALSNIPSTHKGGVTGAAGARVLMDAIVQSIAILELGKDIGKSLVTSKNIGVYKAEQHLDNPMGTAGANDFITDGPKPKLAASPDPKCLKTVDARGDEVVTEAGSSDKATASAHGGSSMPGLQYENPALYEVGEGGLANHLLNSTEHAKDRFLDATKAGPTPVGRMNMGMGQHVIEDYFSHSNFIEVALNRYINDAVSSRKQHKNAAAGKSPEQAAALNKFYDGFIDKDGKPKEGATTAKAAGGVHAEFSFVDTLYDQKTPDGRQAVTTGTFGGTDTKVSLGHVLLPKLPLLESALHKGIDSTFGVIDKAAKEKKAPTWQTIKGLLANEGRNGAIAEVMLEACNTVGLAVPCPTGFHLTYKEVGLPLLGTMSVPNGMDLDYTNVGVSQALVTGAGTYVAVMETLEGLKKASGYLFLDGVITAIQDKVKQAMAAVGAAVRAKMSEMISQYIREMYNIDAKSAAHASVGELSHMAEEQMHEMEERTSMQSRLQDGGDLHGLTEQGDNGRKELERRVGPVKAKDESLPKATWGTAANPWVTVNALPPSHSEISKDHPPHAHEGDKPEWHKESKEKEAIRDGVSEGWDHAHDHDHNEEEEEHGHEALNGGSSFYELHRRLAVEADRHVMKQMETIWGASLIPGKKIDEDGMSISHDKMLKSAGGVAKEAAEASERGGFRHAQSDERIPAELRKRPEVMAMLDLVDYFVSHPTASTWWRGIFDSYIASDSQKVYADILARNKTRGRRQAPGK